MYLERPFVRKKHITMKRIKDFKKGVDQNTDLVSLITAIC